MSLYKDITVIIVTFKSEHIIDKTIKNLSDKFNIIIVENSSNLIFKRYIEKNFLNCKVILTGDNLGVSKAVNIALKKIKTKFSFFVTPDAFPKKDCIFKLYKTARINNKIAIISPRNINYKLKNQYGVNLELNKILNNSLYYKKNKLMTVDWVLGGALFFNMNCISKIGLFDEKYFLDFEEIDLCVRAKKNNFDVILNLNAFTENLEHGSVNTDNKNSLNNQRNWHYGWSMFYFYRKNFGYFFSFRKNLKTLIKSFLKFIYYLSFLNFTQAMNHLFFLRGYLSSMFGLNSSYRAKI